MYLRMIPTGLGMSTRFTVGDEQTGTEHSVFFRLDKAGDDLLLLETGEVFRNPTYFRVRGDKRKQIYAQLRVSPASDLRDPSHTNDVRYFAEDKGNDVDDFGSPSSIYFHVSIPASDYSLLLNNIRGGIMPSYVTVGFRDDFRGPITFGIQPDEIIWRNAVQENRIVDVESIEFQYELIDDVYSHYSDDFGRDRKPPTAKASIDAASDAIVAKLTDLEKALVKGSGFIVFIVAAIIVVCAVLYFARH